MAVVECVVSYVSNKLAAELAAEVSRLRAVRGQVEWVETELRRMHCFLRDADTINKKKRSRKYMREAEEESERMKNWRRELQGLVYSADDVIDRFVLSVEHARRRRQILQVRVRGGGGGRWLRRQLLLLKSFLLIRQEVIARHKLASEIAHIKLKLTSISDSRNVYGIEFAGQEEEEEEEDEEEQMQLLLQSSPNKKKDMEERDEYQSRINDEVMDTLIRQLTDDTQ